MKLTELNDLFFVLSHLSLLVLQCDSDQVNSFELGQGHWNIGGRLGSGPEPALELPSTARGKGVTVYTQALTLIHTLSTS